MKKDNCSSIQKEGLHYEKIGEFLFYKKKRKKREFLSDKEGDFLYNKKRELLSDKKEEIPL